MMINSGSFESPESYQDSNTTDLYLEKNFHEKCGGLSKYDIFSENPPYILGKWSGHHKKLDWTGWRHLLKLGAKMASRMLNNRKG